jgi:transcriptional regulator with XRE-family HTH domain
MAMTIRSGRCRIRSILLSKKMSQTELAIKTSLTPQKISDYVNNRQYMSMMNAAKIAKALDVSIDDLYVWIE